MDKKNKEIKIVLATRIDKNGYDGCIKELKERFTDSKYIKKIYILCDLYKNIFTNENIIFETIFDMKPIRQTAFNKVIVELNKNKEEQHHLLTFSKEVEFQQEHINKMINELENDEEKIIVVGYRLKDNILSDDEIKSYSNIDLRNKDTGIAYSVPWNTCALWNKKFVYGEDDTELNFDEICEKDKNQLGELKVKVNGKLLSTDYEGMEDGLAIARLVTNNPDKCLKYKLIKESLYWNIYGDKERLIKHKKKMARKNIVLSTFMNIKGYSTDKFKKAKKD